jgi:hypothetical protein
MRQRCGGVVLLALGRPDDAVAPLESAVESFEAIGHAPDAARAVLLRGRALLRGGHRTLAADALADARGRFAVLGGVLWGRARSRSSSAPRRDAPRAS